ncbi:MAG: histidine phosphatase family protein [Candidatus Heimdallarchaeota archaeon]|nr:histidine phosphatase family protein [Candidatus Heimdallarchaeota archaeon]MCK4955113.1 histidine phosphatase family protein [Candidatus Heimdallarchaeota archaeon]
MKIIEHRRHSIRVKPSKHISQEGVNLARKVGEKLGYFDRIYTSSAPRAIETAVAMGYAVDETFEELSQTPEDLNQEIVWGIGFPEYASVIRKGGVTADYSKKIANFLKSLAKNLPENGSALLISHGGLLEISAVGCLPENDFSSWGEATDSCEGVRMFFDGEKFVRIKLLRK